MKLLPRIVPACLLIAAMLGNAFATTWAPKDFTCPIDGQKNTFMVVMSYGSYIYWWPSKYQWLFWPTTDSPTYYSCKKCHLTTYMWDFDNLPKDKLPELQKALAQIKFTGDYKEYTEIPITKRLEIMEKVYSVLNKDENWWENFYRTEGYHYGKEGNVEKAAEARKKSLAIIQKKLSDPKNESPRKLLLYTSGAMKHFLGDDKGALEDLNTALNTKYAEKDGKPEEIKSAEDGLNERLKDYIERIKSEKDKPRFFDKYRDDEH